ncbi:trp operon repressor [Patescibacteria group bacterium]|nr:trp operon repressor [Patescibacteria group bacterium]MBU1613160.1 trp operon repressor [Patescibacteria group bacterium]
MKSWRTPKILKLAKAFVGLDNAKDMANFLRDLCTMDELEELSNRWNIVLMLEKGISYRKIAEKTGVSTTTITRIAWWLENGEGGYRVALQKPKKSA